MTDASEPGDAHETGPIGPAPGASGRPANAGSGVEGTDVDDPMAPAQNPGMGEPTNDQDDLADANVTGSGVSNREDAPPPREG
jgi:hypothetical protein